MSENTFEQNEYLDLGILGGNGEELPDGPLKSAGYRPTSPGEYISQSRTIKARKITQGQYAGHLEFEVVLTGGVQDPNSGRVFNEKFPLSKKLTTIPFTDNNGVQDTGVAQYLRAFNYRPQGMTLQDIITAIQETQNIPCKVFISRKDKAVKGEDGKWTSKNLKLKDFEVVGPEGVKHYLDEVVVDGVRYEAKPTVGSFSRL